MDEFVLYRIRVRGVVPDRYVERLGGMRVFARAAGITTLEGPLPDQAALAGVLDTLFALRLVVIEVSSSADEAVLD